MNGPPHCDNVSQWTKGRHSHISDAHGTSFGFHCSSITLFTHLANEVSHPLMDWFVNSFILTRTPLASFKNSLWIKYIIMWCFKTDRSICKTPRFMGSWGGSGVWNIWVRVIPNSISHRVRLFSNSSTAASALSSSKDIIGDNNASLLSDISSNGSAQLLPKKKTSTCQTASLEWPGQGQPGLYQNVKIEMPSPGMVTSYQRPKPMPALNPRIPISTTPNQLLL